MPRILVLMIVSLALAACGGGGGGDNNGGGGGGTNGAPTVSTTSFTVNQDTDLTAKIVASDPENDALTLAKTTDPTNGTIVSFAADGSFVYRPKANYRGTDTFTISAADASHTVPATITITVAAVNHAPVIRNDVVKVSASAATIDVLANDSDPDGDTLTLSIFENPVPSTVTAEVVNGKVQLHLPTGFRGFTRFAYYAQDPAGAGSSATVAVFVDTDPVRLVYQTNESIDAQNLFVDDLTGRQQISSFTSASVTSLGHSNVSTNGRTIVWEEATGSDATHDYQAQSIWTAPTDRSSPARQVNAALAAGEKVNVRSPISADGKYIVYGVTNAGGTAETLYLANLLAGGTSVVIPKPAGTVRIESERQSILFGPTSQYVYFTATSSFGGVDGQATYRISVSDPATAVPISTAAVATREAAVRLIASDDSRVVELLTLDGSAPVIERVDFSGGGASAPVTLSHTMGAMDKVVDMKADPDFKRVAYMVQSSQFFLYAADIVAGTAGVQIRPIPSDSANPPPTIDAVRANGDYALVHTLEQTSGGSTPTYNEDLAELELFPSGSAFQIQSRPQNLNVYTYVDNFTSVAFTTDDGVAVASRNNLGSRKIVLGAQSVFFEFSADSELVAGITATRELVLASRDGDPVQLTGIQDPTSQTLSVRVIPGN